MVLDRRERKNFVPMHCLEALSGPCQSPWGAQGDVLDLDELRQLRSAGQSIRHMTAVQRSTRKFSGQHLECCTEYQAVRAQDMTTRLDRKHHHPAVSRMEIPEFPQAGGNRIPALQGGETC